MRILLPIAVLVIVFPLALSSQAQTCTTDFMTCGSSWAEPLETAGCTFEDDPRPYWTWYIDLEHETTITIRVEATEFPPMILLYRGDESSPLTSASGSGTATLTYSIPTTDTYWIVITTADPALASGIFELRITCATVCHAPAVVSATQVLRADYGKQVRITIDAQGTPNLRFRWFDEALPSVTLATTYMTFITSPVTKKTTYGVEVSNDCGTVKRTAAVVNVSTPKKRSVRH